MSEGGHNIPEDIIRRRYKKGIYNLINLFIPIVDNWIIIDNSENPFSTISEGLKGEGKTVYNESTWNRLIEISMKNKELRDKIISGLELSFKRLVISKSKEDKELVFSKDGKIIKVKAKDLK